MGAPSVPRRPSQTVSGVNSTRRSPAASERAVSAAPSGSARTSSTAGLAACSASRVPAARPPPPTGTTINSRPSLACSSSSAAVPWPAITWGSVYGCTRVAPVSAWTWAHIASRAVIEASQRHNVAPWRPMLASFAATAPSGTTTWQAIPRVRAASANAAPWLPEEWVTTPRRACASSSAQTALQAPRNLNAPLRCRCSALKNTVAPVIASSVRERSTGVTQACTAMRAAAASTSSTQGKGESLMTQD
ncbi:hypothetical protein D3C71_1341830 [compost metagenome]